MTPKEVKMFCTLIRRIHTFRAERMALTTIIKHAAEVNQPPRNWKRELIAIRKTLAYRAVLEEDEATLAQLEAAADDSRLRDLFAKLSKDKMDS